MACSWAEPPTSLRMTDPSVASLTRTGNQTVKLKLLKVGTTLVIVLAGGHTAGSTITVH